MQILFIDGAALGGGSKPTAPNCAAHRRPGQGAAVTRVEPEELARFEGEGGLEAPEPAASHPEEWSAQ